MGDGPYMSDSESEDWIKARSWGLVGVETLAELLEHLQVTHRPEEEQRERLRHFTTLPAWRPAPAALKKEVGEFLVRRADGGDSEEA